ncbi:MAG TPA: sigma 54-interacting transcriptional regulator, partial [Negativicutes bacterium]
ALALRKPIQVSGAEHYCRQHHCLTCSAAPIWDSRGQLIGILDLSGASYLTHLHTLGMVVAAAAAIMAQLVIQQKNRELTLTNKRLTNVFNTMSDGVLVIDQYGIINELNPVAKTIIGKSKEEILGLPAEKLFGDKSALYHKILRDKESFVDVEITTYTGKGCLAAGEPITDERGNVTGGLIILRPLKQIKNLVNRFNGNYGTLQFSDIIGTSKGILEAIRVASLAANSIANVLLQGESGTGKEIFAQAIHNRSERNNGPFIAVNCGAIPRELIGSELFGYEEGSFTGARRGGKPGKFELAAGGTLFLDEIGDMPLEQQVSLLRVLQDRKVVRIGGDKVIPVDVRVICATNKNLLTEVDIGKFRKDLYYRLNVISIIIPPLRERVEDIVLLFGYFLEKMDKKLGRVFCIQPEVIERITCYDWPGNVRELQNVVERIISLTEDQNISLAHLPTEFNPASGPAQQSVLPLVVKIAGDRQERRRRVAESERQEIMLLLNEHGGNISVTAQQLGVSRNTLYRKMRLYDIKN